MRRKRRRRRERKRKTKNIAILLKDRRVVDEERAERGKNLMCS
jgi:hypothetical protein